MSTLVQPLPSTWSHAEHPHAFASQGHSTAFEYLGASSLSQHSTLGALQAPQVSSGIARRPLIDSNARRLSQRSSETMFRSPPMRDRTPIRHHRLSLPRARSSSRPNALLAYASEQQSQQHVRQQTQQQHLSMLSSQAAPTGNINFRAPTYAVPMSHGYGSPSLYYNSPNLSHETTQQGMGSNLFGAEPIQLRYYPLEQSTSQSADPAGATFNPQEALYIQNTAPSDPPSLLALGSNTQANIQPYPPTPTPLESSREDFRGTVSRPKPQCFDHGCNGREFSTFSNLLRHQRERSGNASKATCPYCGTEFTRTTARNGHLLSGKCKGRPDQSQGGPEEGD